MNAISASPLDKRPWAVARNCGLTARQYISTMTDSANTARGGSSNHSNTIVCATPPVFWSSGFWRRTQTDPLGVGHK